MSSGRRVVTAELPLGDGAAGEGAAGDGSAVRAVTASLPAEAPVAVVFAADGQGTSVWAEDLDGAGLPPIAFIGVHGLDDETARLHEYSPVFDAEVFAAHERFFTEVVPRWASDELGIAFPADRTAVLGASAGGELALALGLRHPDRYGAVLAGSPGAGFRPEVPLPGALPRTYLVAGAGEPFFLENAERWARALGETGAEVVFRVREGEHSPALWRAELSAMAAWAFGAASAHA